MMKKFTIMFVLLVAVSFSYGQYYYVPNIAAGQNPGGLNIDDEYPVGGGLSATWNSLQGPSATVPAWSPQTSIPFAFNFNGTPVTSYYVSTSGVLTFSSSVSTAPSYTNVAIPSASIPDNSVCVWGIKGIGTNDFICTKTFGTAPNRQYWVFFTSYTGETATSWQYWSIVMEETTNKIYIVDQRFSGTTSTLTVGIQLNSTTAIQVTGSPNLACTAGSNANPSDNSYYEFIPGVQSSYDIWMKSIDVYPTVPLTAAPFTITGKLMNLGSITVDSLVLNYNIDGGAPISANITGLSIASNTNYSYTHPQTWTPAATGVYTLKSWVSSINGNPDQFNDNDTVTILVNVVSQVVQRMPMHEAFTSSTCAPCVAGNTNLNTVFTANPNKWVCLKYQMSWPGNGDPYYTDEGGERRTYYGINSVPNLVVEGNTPINTSSYTSASLNNYYANPSFINLTANALLTGHTVNIDINVDPVADITSSNLRLHCAIFEYETHQNVGGNGETTFKYVMKKMVPDASGTSIGSLISGTPVTQSLSYTFNGFYRLPPNSLTPINNAIEHSVEEFSDLGVVVWIQDNATKEVFQSCYATFTVGTSEIGDPNGIIGLYPNPANSQAYIHYFLKNDAKVSIDLYNVTGQKVYSNEVGHMSSGAQSLNFDTQNLPGGLYIVRLSLDDKTYTTKLNITH